MSSEKSLKFKIATSEWEIEAIHALNYKTFVEEIPQHSQSEARRLVDKFHEQNTYVICLDGDTLVGMLAMRAQRPFSLDQKIPNLNDYLPKNRSICEIRLLSVEKEYRNGYVFRGLLALVLEHGKKQGYDFAIISGTTRQEKLYRHLGFVPFGPQVGSGEARFQPMCLTLETIEEKSTVLFTPPRASGQEAFPVSFLPGPVDIASEVRAAFDANPVSHRARSFQNGLDATKSLLKQLTSASNVEVLLGSGSLANDVVAGQLSLLSGDGLVVSNGEFGERLMDHAARFGLRFEAIRLEWGRALEISAVRQTLETHPKIGWIWAVHCETSTGVLNDVHGLQSICAARGVKLCLDCISSIGTVPVNLRDIYLASCVSGKGLGAYPGLSMVFYNHLVKSAPGLPRYLDLGFYAAQAGIPFTHSSNLLAALHTALKRVNWPERFGLLTELSSWVRGRLREMDYEIVAPNARTSPAVFTLTLPPEVSSKTIGWLLQKAGYLLSYRSEYLLKRNWIQICLMGELSRQQLEALLEILGSFRPNSLRRRRRAPLEALAI